jgi:hypothetical protein
VGAISAVIVLRLSVGLAILYGVVVVIWYELLRAAIMSRVRRRRGEQAQMAAFHDESWEEAERAESQREAAEQEAAEASEPDPARRLYYLARKAASAERDLAIETAGEATKQAVERIERRYREIDAEIEREEVERVKGA